nr:immunoglobulin heavy chain junction region [Mus musculus]MBK4197524.1 immunoglobulin heavy chain junction region [Mus musculus]MBK4197525.1 immunoglobulin heavy chain junction region [Mus musculus]MBK4197526.1 immunoglobulin heavy chain junction region [Mus musculus]
CAYGSSFWYFDVW